MTNIEVISLILKNYKFETPIPRAVRHLMLDSRRRNLIFILKKFGKYGLFTLGAVNLMFFVKKFGFSLTITKTYIIVTAAAAVAAGALTTASVISVKRFIDSQKSIITPGDIAPAQPVESAAQSVKPVTGNGAAPSAVIINSLEIKPLTAPGDLSAESKNLTREILNQLNTIKGDNSVFISGSGVSREAPMILVGSIVKLGDSYTINARLVDTKSSRMVILITEKFNKGDNVTDTAKSIAVKIAPLLKK